MTNRSNEICKAVLAAPKTTQVPGMVCVCCGAEFTATHCKEYRIMSTLCPSCGKLMDTPYGYDFLPNSRRLPLYPDADHLMRMVRGERKLPPRPNVPDELVDTDLDLLPDREAYEEAIRWAPGMSRDMGFPGGQIMYGRAQQGKSRAATALALKLWQMGHTVVYRDCGKLTQEITNSQLEKYEYQLISSLNRVDILILDDLCNYGGGPAARSRLAGIIKVRGEEGRCTIITTQHGGDSIAAWFKDKEGAAVAERLRRYYLGPIWFGRKNKGDSDGQE